MHRQKDWLGVFGPVWGASGVRGFFGEQYWYQKLFAKYVPGYSFDGVTFVAKTATANPNAGNAELNDDGFTLKEKRPACIVLGWWQLILGVTLNAMNLPNIGFESLERKGLWQNKTEPFMLSLMLIGQTPEEREKEMAKIIERLWRLIPTLNTSVGIQINDSCPNVKHRLLRAERITEIRLFLSRLEPIKHRFHVPIFVKVNTEMPIFDACRIAEHPVCSGFIVSNTMRWAIIPKWMRLLFFGSTTSPLAHLGGGGLSGWPLRRRVCKWIRAVRKAGVTKHINAGGGINGPFAVWSVYCAGANSISLGTIATVRPWMLGPTKTFAHWLFSRKQRRVS